MDAHTLYCNRFRLHLETRQGNGDQVIVKEPAQDEATRAQIAELRNEHAITLQLADVTGVRRAYALAGSESRPRLLLEYVDGRTLSETVSTADLSLPDRLELACQAAGILARIHSLRIMHRDVSSGNILVANRQGQDSPCPLTLIDFGSAVSMRQESQGRVNAGKALSSTLAYISPEQTGRINRLVDYRTDLYSLGVTLYELFTGRLPFHTDDALEMIHCHIARQPTPLHEVDSDIPLPLSQIVMKLLEKNAEDRYQTAAGLQADLGHCLDQLEATGDVRPFDLGDNDFGGRLHIPQKLYGRKRAINQLLGAFDRVMQDKAEILLVAGHAGVGKTALVHEIRASVAARGGAFVEGKFDQFQRDIPYTAWAQAFSALANNWLTDSDTDLHRWRAATLDAVGHNGRVLTELLPALELVIGPQPDTLKLSGRAAENRLSYLFQHFVSAVATPEHPLVIFLDDVQWIDSASLSLLEALLTDPSLKYLLIIAAFRDNEVNPNHPLIIGINELKGSGVIVGQIELGNLADADITQLLSDALRMSHSHCLPLAQLLHAKTGGNALFIRQLLHTLEDDGLLAFDNSNACWRWEAAEVAQVAATDNIIDLLVDRQRRLPPATQETLRFAAGIGNRFEPELLSLAIKQSQTATQEILDPAFQEGLLISAEGVAWFAHDRIQQAVYSLIAEPEKASMHWQIGSALLSESPVSVHDERLFTIVRHLNIGSSMIGSESERIELTELNLAAAQEALRTTAFASALAYARFGIELLAGDSWQACYRTTLDLHQAAADAAYLSMDLEESERAVAVILSETRVTLDRVPAYVTQIRVHNARNEMDAVMAIGMAGLEELGFTLVQAAPAEMSIETVSDLERMTDPHALAAADLLNNLMVTAYVAKPELFAGIVFTSMQISIEYGLHPASPLTVSTLGVLAWSEDIGAAYRWGELALELVDRLDAAEYLAQVKTVFDGFILPWKRGYRVAEREAIADIQLALESGGKVWATSAITSATYLPILNGRPLDQAQEQIAHHVQLLQDIGERYAQYNVAVWRQFAANLRGLSADPALLEGEFYSETRDLPLARSANMNVPVFFTHMLRQVLAFHLRDFYAAYAASLDAEETVVFLRSHVSVPWLSFYQSLVILQFPAEERRNTEMDEKLSRNIRSLERWAQHAPMNQQHKLDLVLAEEARGRGDVAAVDYYEAAIAGARENQFLHEEALANELYGRFWEQRGNEAFASHSIGRAHTLYRRWKADAIVDRLESQYPSWFPAEPIDATAGIADGSAEPSPDNLDLQSILRASQVVAGEIELEKLLSRLMKIAMENAGAQRGFLISKQGDQWVIEATNLTGEAEAPRMQHTGVDDTDLLSIGVVRYVARSHRTVVLADAANAGDFAHDPYIQQHRVQSLLCLPLVNQASTSGILYLENNLAANVFTAEKVTLLEMLAGQMAISLDHARMVERLGESLALRTTALETAETQVQTLFESAPLGIALSTVDGKLLAVNQAMLRMTGYTEAEILALDAIDLYYDAEERAEFLGRIDSSGSVRDFGVRANRKDGTFFYASLNANRLLAQSDGYSILVVVEDVTAKVLTERALHESNRNLVNLLESARTMTSALELNDLLRVIFEQLGRVSAFSHAVIWLRDGDQLMAQASWPDEAIETLHESRVPRDLLPSTATLLSIRRPISDDDAPSIRRLLRTADVDTGPFGLETVPMETRLSAIPLIAKDRLIGVIGLAYAELGYFTPEVADLVQAFANQAAIAIDNARLHQRVQEAAVLQERDRLARELHDAVTQTLFSASVIAETAPFMWKKDPQTALQYLEPLPVMLRGALAEMRTMLLELRPGALRDQSLGQLLHLLADSARAQTRSVVTVHVEGDRTLPEEVTLTFYRIVQESLNNAAKHAEASQTLIWLNGSPEGVALHVSDDGCGFDPASVPPGHLGLSIMADRAQQIGATFEISSEPGSGTLIFLSWLDPAPSQL